MPWGFSQRGAFRASAGEHQGPAQPSIMPEANYLFSVSWGYIKVCPADMSKALLQGADMYCVLAHMFIALFQIPGSCCVHFCFILCMLKDSFLENVAK